MHNKGRVLYLDICDYSEKKLCTLYDSDSKSSGQATDVYISTERNGWKELSFSLPCVIETEMGNDRNFRLDFLKADYLIRAIDEFETDWFIISEPKITHNGLLKKMSVVAGHVSQLLKVKNLDLEFSDDAGNNVGTAEELAKTILSGTDWNVGYVYPFAEKDGKTKYRSLKASAKTGAFKLLTMMCELFDAKPIFHGDSRTVDIVPINPFSEPDPGALPDIPNESEVIELHYGKNIKNVTRMLNTENMVTKLFAYGAYGDKTSGYCGIDECTHIEYEMTLSQACLKDQVYFFTIQDETSASMTFHFSPNVELTAGTKLIFSLLDPASMLYVWDDSNQNAYPVSKGTVGSAIPADIVSKETKNWFQFVMNFDYYRKTGLLNDEMIQAIAVFQRTTPAKYELAAEASLKMSDAQTALSKTIGVIDFCKLNINHCIEPANGYISLALNKEIYKDGVIYRSDYDKSKDNYFEWHNAESLNADGDPVNSAASILYIIHNTDPVTWDKAYIKAIDDEDDPSILTLWSAAGSINVDVANDSFFLFSYNGINGQLGTLESNDESAVMSLEEALRVVTVDHPVIFTSGNPEITPIGNVNGYGWLWRYYDDAATFRNYNSEMYFAYTDEGDTKWNYVYFTDVQPSGSEENSYWFDWRNSILYRKKNGAWSLMDTAAQKKIAALFATVYMFGKARDRYYQGLYQHYTHTVNGTLPAGNYYIKNEFDSYWAFTTTEDLLDGDSLDYSYEDAWVTQTKNGIQTTLKPKGYRFDNVNYHSTNVLQSKLLENGLIDFSTGTLSDSTSACRSQSFISIVPSTPYVIANLNRNVDIHFYNDKKQWISALSAKDSFTTPGDCSFIRICANVSSDAFTEYNSVTISSRYIDNSIVIEDLNYILLPTTTSGDIIGLVQCIDKFSYYADLTYDEYYKELKSAQDAITEKHKLMSSSVGDLLREGWWQDISYVDGDEDKLRTDALDNLKQISKPEATYTITYLDLYSSNNNNSDYGVVQETVDVYWPDVSITSAAHLVDPEIEINTWAFIDKIQKCYDKPYQTKIAINTNLSTIAQHSFTDVMSNIASVASEMKGKTSYYDKTIDSITSNNNMSEIKAGLVRSEKELLSSYERIEQINGAVVKANSAVKQNADELSSEVSRATEAEGSLSQQITFVKQTADGFSGRIQSAETNASTAKEQVASFGTTVSEYTAKFTSVEKTANDAKNLAAEYKTAVDGYSAQITNAVNTANSASGEVQSIKNTSIFSATADTIRAVVRGETSSGGDASKNQFKTSSVSIDNNGVDITTSGSITIASDNGDDSSAVTIAKDGVAIGSTGTFTVNSANFKVNSEGKMYANDVVINGQVSNNGYPVLSKNYDIYIGTDEPSNKHEGMLWICPTSSDSSGSSGSVTIPTNQTVTFTQSSFTSEHHYFTAKGPLNVSFDADIYSEGSKSSYTYTANVPIYFRARSDGAASGGELTLSFNGITMSSSKHLSASSSKTSQIVWFTLSTTSSVWCGNLSTIWATLSFKQDDSAYKTGQICTYPGSTYKATITCS